MSTIEFDVASLTREFITEGVEILERIEEAALKLEERPGDLELLRAMFRGAHTLKGNASCLAFEAMTHAAHAFEDVIDALVKKSIPADSQLITLMLRLIDEFREWLPDSAKNGDVERPAANALAKAMRVWLTEHDDGNRTAVSDGGTNKSFEMVRALRVDVDRLDRMADLASELAIARGRLGRSVEQAGSPELAESFAETERLAIELQELVTRARMVPVGTVFRPFVRTVRDLAAAQGKKAHLLIRGAETEVDLSIVEHLRDPLMHMIRNSIDHGIELPEEREAARKSPEGTLTLTAGQEGGSIVVELHDDGRGLDRDAILRKARQAGFADVEHLTDREIYRLILEPGFSTAGTVTEMSGRGVGLDVVRRNVESLRGSVEIENNDGAVFKLRLPLTLAIIDGFAVVAGGDTYILPVDAVVECVDLNGLVEDRRPRLSESESNEDRRGRLSSTAQRFGDDSEGVIDLRGEALPYVSLGSLFGGAHSRCRQIVVVESPSGRAGLAVEQLLGQSQTAIKPLGTMLQSVRDFCGSSILSDGRVALLVDVPAVVQRAARASKLKGERHG